MTSSLLKNRSAAPPVAPLSPWGSFPQAVRALYVTTLSCPADRLSDKLAGDRAMSVAMEACLGSKAGLERLRETNFDVVLVQHHFGELDAVEFTEAHRATGSEDPLVVLTRHPVHELAPLCYEVGADACLNYDSATTRELIWTIGRAIQWRRLLAENRRLGDLERQRHRSEHHEAERLLEEQRGLVSGLEELSQRVGVESKWSLTREFLSKSTTACPAAELPTSLVSAYSDLLRAYVIMGSGNLAAETTSLVDELARLDAPAPRVMQLHVHVLEDTLRGLGGRSSRHVMARADLLVLEVMAQLAERYRLAILARTSGSG